jgi:hypothetical protein
MLDEKPLTVVDSEPMLLAFVLTLLDRPATVLFVVDRPVLSDVTPLCAVLIPVDVDVDSDAMLLAFVLTLLDRPATVLFVVLKPVDSEFTPL